MYRNEVRYILNKQLSHLKGKGSTHITWAHEIKLCIHFTLLINDKLQAASTKVGKLQVGEVCELSELKSSDVLPPARSHILNFSKYHHQLQNKWSSTEPMEDISHSSPYSAWDNDYSPQYLLVFTTDGEHYICLTTFAGTFIERSLTHNNNFQDLEKFKKSFRRWRG